MVTSEDTPLEPRRNWKDGTRRKGLETPYKIGHDKLLCGKNGGRGGTHVSWDGSVVLQERLQLLYHQRILLTVKHLSDLLDGHQLFQLPQPLSNMICTGNGRLSEDNDIHRSIGLQVHVKMHSPQLQGPLGCYPARLVPRPLSRKRGGALPFFSLPGDEAIIQPMTACSYGDVPREMRAPLLQFGRCTIRFHDSGVSSSGKNTCSKSWHCQNGTEYYMIGMELNTRDQNMGSRLACLTSGPYTAPR